MDNDSYEKQKSLDSIAEMKEQYEEDDYTFYIDTSDVIIDYYKNQKASGLEKYFLQIENWIEKPRKEKEDNKPLVITAGIGAGIGTLVAKWMEYHNQNIKKKQDDIIISHFVRAGASNSNYFFAIYRILIRLREYLNIAQKVELLEEKLRKYFAYWLDVCNEFIHKQIVNDQNIILIIEGIDHFVDQEEVGKIANVAFWLPRYFPDRVRVIVTCDPHSEAFKYFEKLQCDTLVMEDNTQIASKLIQNHLENQNHFLPQETINKLIKNLDNYNQHLKSNSLFVKTYLNMLLPYVPANLTKLVPELKFNPEKIQQIIDEIDIQKLQAINSVQELFDFVLNLYEDKLMQASKYKKLLYSFLLTQKGFNYLEIILLANYSHEEWEDFLIVFFVHLQHFRGLWQIKHDELKNAIQRKYQLTPKQIQGLHEEIETALEKTPTSLRQLEEITYHLYKSNSYFKLKETVSNIENFLLMFNPNNKYDLCRYWQKLEEKGFDPAIEYNKAIEGFEMHYHPQSEDIFKIILQISRFLKEFSDFETYYTPEFRHPQIKSGVKEMDDIGLLWEICQLNLFIPTNPLDIEEWLQKKKNYNVQQIKEKLQQIYNQSRILNEIESLNIDIPSNREIVREHFNQKLRQQFEENIDVTQLFSNNQEIQNNNNTQSQTQLQMDQKSQINTDDGESYSEKNEGQFEFAFDKKQHNGITKKKIQFKQVNTLKEREPTYYYYKRWLWMIFPLACSSQEKKCNYSEQIEQCSTSSTNYMTVVAERKYTKGALMIALEAKLKKKMMYAKAEDTYLMQQKNSLENIKKEYQRLEKLDTKEVEENTVDQNELNQESKFEKKKRFSQQGENDQIREIKKRITHNHNNSKDDDNFFITNDNTLQFDEQNSKTFLPYLNTSKSADQTNTSKILNKTKQFRNKSIYETDQSLMKINKRQDQQSLNILPRLKDSIYTHSLAEIQVLEKQQDYFIQEYNYLVYKNKRLQDELTNLVGIFNNQTNYGKDQQKAEQLMIRIKDIDRKQKQVDDAYKSSQLQKSRLQQIILVCKRNTNQNEDWIRNLSFLLSNYKKLIKMEIDKINRDQYEIKKYYKLNLDYQTACISQQQNHERLVEQIQQNIKNKYKFDELVSQTDMIIENSALDALDQLKIQQDNDKQKKESNIGKLIQKDKSQILNQQVLDYERQFQRLYEALNLDIREQIYQDNKTFQQYQQNIEKKRELEGIILQRIERIKSLNRQLQDIKKQNEIYQKVYSNPKYLEELLSKKKNNDTEISKLELQENITEQHKDHENNQRTYQKLNEINLKCLMSLKMLISDKKVQKCTDKKYEINDLKEFKPQEMLLSQLKMYLEDIKNKLTEEQFEQFNSGRYDFNELYKNIQGVTVTKNPYLEELKTY